MQPHNIEQSSMCCTVGPWLSILNLWRQPLVCSLSLTKWLLKVKLCSKPSRPCYLTQRKMCKSLNSLCMLSCFNWVQPFVALWTVACQASLSIGFSRQENWSAFQCPLPGDLPYPGIKPTSPTAPALQADSLPLSYQGSPYVWYIYRHVSHAIFVRVEEKLRGSTLWVEPEEQYQL